VGKQLKILHLVEASWAGVGRHVTDLAGGLAKRGHEVHVLYSPVRMDNAFAQALERFIAGSPLVRTRAVPMRRAPHPSDGAAMKAVRSYLSKEGHFDVIHVHSTKAGIVGRIAALGHRCAKVYTPNAPASSDPSLDRVRRSLIRGLERALGAITHAVIAVSHEEREHLRGLGLRDEKLFLVPNGIAVPDALPTDRREKARRDLCIDPGDILIGAVGRLSRQKNTGLLLRAFAEIAHLLPETVRLAIVGDGPLAGELRALGVELGIDRRLLWLGVRDGSAAMHAFDIFALPSLYEGLPYVLLEAMAAGLPLVSTQVGGTSLVIENGVNGWIVPIGASNRMAAALLPLALQQELRDRMGRASRARIHTFSVETMILNTESVYQTVLEHPAKQVAQISAAKTRHRFIL
jgi:glycosyltransferase involved in cell wall biosynthesis